MSTLIMRIGSLNVHIPDASLLRSQKKIFAITTLNIQISSNTNVHILTVKVLFELAQGIVYITVLTFPENR